MATPWILRTHPDYEDLREKDVFAWDHFSGEVKAKAVAAADSMSEGSDKTGKYLRRRSQGESVKAFQERANISRYPRHMSKVVGSFTGSLFLVEEKATREWGPMNDDDEVGGLGDPEKEDSIMHKIWYNCDGAGTNWLTQRKMTASRFSVLQKVWYMAEPTGEDGEEAECKLIDNWNVRDFYEEDGVLKWVILREQVDNREDPQDIDNAEREERFVFYDVDGWERYRIEDGEDGRNMVLEDEGEWSQPFYKSKAQQVRRVPIDYVELPLGQHIGKLIADDANYLYNLLSDPRNTLRIANHPRLTGDVEDDQYEKSLEKLAEGWNVMQGEWSYISPDPANAKVAYDIYKEEVKDFYITSFQLYEDRARERTATEIRQEQSGGRHAYLSLLAGAVDEIENDLLFLLTQIYFPTQTDLWGSARVNRSDDYKPVDSQERAKIISEILRMLPVEIPPASATMIVKEILDGLGVPYDDEEMDDLAQAGVDTAGLVRRLRERNGQPVANDL